MLKEIFYSLGQADARDLRARAADMDGTGIIREEHKVPRWDHAKDYTQMPVGTPVRDQGQVWTLLQPHNAASFQGRPADLRALWSLCHTKDPSRAKPWAAPNGISGMYMTGECYKDEGGTVWRCLQDNIVHDAAALPQAWEEVKE